MSRVEGLYCAEGDRAAREQGLVYIEDLAVSGLMIALKISCAPQGLGFIDARPVEPEAERHLHQDIRLALGSLSVGSSVYLERHDRGSGVVVTRDHHSRLCVGAGYWDGRPLKLRLFAGNYLDPQTLTGFLPFDPRGYDRYQGIGRAQMVVDALRDSGDPLSMEVAINEGGRTFARAKEAEAMIGSEYARELYDITRETSVQVHSVPYAPELVDEILEALERVDCLRER